MSVGLSYRVGDRLPIGLQLESLATDRFPQAVVRNENGGVVTTLDLVHVSGSNGFYQPAAAYNMPDEPFLNVQYLVYTDSGHTTLSPTDQPSMDHFKRKDTATQASVDAIPTNPLLTNDSRLNNLDATISSRATQTSVNAIPTNPLLTNDGRLDNLDATISSRSTQVSVDAIPTNPLLTNDARLNNLDATISSRASSAEATAIANAIAALNNLAGPDVANAVWNALLSSHTGAGSTGEKLGATSTAGNVSDAETAILAAIGALDIDLSGLDIRVLSCHIDVDVEPESHIDVTIEC